MDAQSRPAYRWYILALIFFATTINYLDRIVFSFLIPVIRDDLHLSTEQYGYINGAFQIAYTAGFIIMGSFVDRFGTRIGYAVSIAWWSVAAALHAFSAGAISLSFWRAMLGFGEAGNFPAAIKGVSEWFPPKDRAYATGIFNSGTSLASTLGPPLFAAASFAFGWKACFLITGSMGLVWLILWLPAYKQPPVVAEEISFEPKMSWREALEIRATWGFALAKFFTDPVWWFYLYWLPLYFYDVRKFDLKAVGWAIPVVYVTAAVGSVSGGWLSGFFIAKGWPPRRARMAALLTFALMMPIGALSVLVANPYYAIALICLATSAHQAWSANLYTTTSDAFPKSAVASVTGIGGCLGGLGGFLFSAVIPGYVVQNFGYTPVFLTMGCFHLIGLACLHWGQKVKPQLVPVAA